MKGLIFPCSKSKIETLEKGVFIVNFEYISNVFLLFLLLGLTSFIVGFSL